MSEDRDRERTGKEHGGPGSGIGIGGARLPDVPEPSVDETGRKAGESDELRRDIDEPADGMSRGDVSEEESRRPER